MELEPAGQLLAADPFQRFWRGIKCMHGATERMANSTIERDIFSDAERINHGIFANARGTESPPAIERSMTLHGNGDLPTSPEVVATDNTDEASASASDGSYRNKHGISCCGFVGSWSLRDSSFIQNKSSAGLPRTA